jgi:hypothetical protein
VSRRAIEWLAPRNSFAIGSAFFGSGVAADRFGLPEPMTAEVPTTSTTPPTRLSHCLSVRATQFLRPRLVNKVSRHE